MRRPPSTRPRRGPLRTALFIFSVCLAAVIAPGCDSDSSSSEDDGSAFDLDVFLAPPRDLAPRIRFWWPGGAVEDDVVTGELRQLAEVGYGGVELQTLTLGLSPVDLEADPRILTVGSDTFLARVRHLAEEADALGLAWDLTVGSGWPNGGPAIVEEAEKQLLMATNRVSGPGMVSMQLPRPSEPNWVDTVNTILPAVGPFDDDLELVAVVAAELIDSDAQPPVLGTPVDVTSQVADGMLTWEAPPGEHRIFALYSNRVFHFVLGHAFPGPTEAALVVDHLDRSGIEGVIASQGDPWLDALEGVLPDTVFIDSFELVAELPWTGSFSASFQESNEYSLLPYLPFVFRDGGEAKYTEILRATDQPSYGSEDRDDGIRAREDYEETRDQLFRDGFIDPAREWADRRGVKLRLQAHGGYSDIIDSYAASHVPEAEGLYGRGTFDFLKLAASAAHLNGLRDVSSESFVLTHLVGTAPLTTDDLWLLTGRAFAAGITRLVHHGFAYPYQRNNGQSWYPFQPGDDAITAGPLPITTDFRPRDPAFDFLPELNLAQSRIAYAMTRGRHRGRLAWLMAERQFRDEPIIINAPLVPERFETELGLAIRREGYVYDRISRGLLSESTADDGALHVGQASYRMLLVSDLEAAEPALLEAIEAALDANVPVLVVGALPTRATGLRDREARDRRVTAAAERLRGRVFQVADADDVAQALIDSGVAPALRVREGTGTLSIEHRDLDGQHLFFLFNESYETRTWTVETDLPVQSAWLLDPESGESISLPAAGTAANPSFEIMLPAVRGRILHIES